MPSIFKKWAKPGLFCLFSSFSQNNEKYSITFNYGKSVDGVLGTRTRGGMMMVGADEYTELWRHPSKNIFLNLNSSSKIIQNTINLPR